jgi:hypothetical protein
MYTGYHETLNVCPVDGQVTRTMLGSGMSGYARIYHDILMCDLT